MILGHGFGYVPTVVALLVKGLNTIAYVKKYAYWPKYVQAEEALQEMQKRKWEQESVEWSVQDQG